ncbi:MULTISPECIES: MaoC family dehydratase [unclassified Marinobacter]|uniref:MaoC family dehydratase n=1 Tax=unclassified Marinobacter TaxID=83889 RepID=UPI001268ADFA|nr:MULTISPECIES: MaoC family dehydratase [unclassified Marinobacter]QFS87730.1 (R)-specific enoyl-CoA hydratase [Marinobacter sp. THAF197a]QFT51515.1 (R)-specific enoyl-CoA hydratase [Marinobacter sp. THAF39]
MRSWRIEDLREGMTASYSQTITDYDVKAFAGISGDHNPIHIDDEYAAKSRFKRRIAHGFHSASFFSAIFGTQLPGKGCVYASQSLNFKRPVYLGDTVTASVTVIGIDLQSKKVDFETVCKVRNKVVTNGFESKRTSFIM